MTPLGSAIARLRRFAAAVATRAAVPYAVLGATSVALAGIYLAAMLHHTGGQVGAPIDDVYIHYQYARQMAAGHFFEYNPGDGLSTGATSLLWTPIVALGYALGFHGIRIIHWTLGLNTLLLFAYGVLLYRLAWLFFDGRLLATLLAAMILLEGRVLWGFFAGMEVGLYHVLQLSVLYFFAVYQRDGHPRQRTAWVVALSLLVLVRPEGVFLAGFALVLFGAWRFVELRPPGRWWPGRSFLWRREWWLAALPLALVLVEMVVFTVATGHATQNGMRTKSHLYAPDQTLWGVLVPSFKFYQDMIFRHFPWLFDTSLRHVMDLFLFAGFLFWGAHELQHRRPGMFCLMGLWFFGGLGIQSVVLDAAYHHGRYQMNYTFIFWFVFIAGVHWVLIRLHLPRRVGRAIVGVVMGFSALLMLNTVVIMSEVFGKDCRAINEQHVAMGHYVREHVPAEAAVGINDAGAIAYYGERYVYDVFGLTTNLSAERKWDGQACIFEEILHLDPARPPRRPDYFAIYPDWYPVVVRAGFLREITRFRVAPPSICGAETKALYAIDWQSFGDETVPAEFRRRPAEPALRVVDRLDVAWRADEIAHEHRHWRLGRPSAWGSDLLHHQTYEGDEAGQRIVDGGREIAEREELRVRGLDPAARLVVVRRTDGDNAACRVLVDGREVGRWAASEGSEKHFRDDSFELAPGFGAATEVTLRFEVEPSPTAAGSGAGAKEPADEAAPAEGNAGAGEQTQKGKRPERRPRREPKRPAPPRYRSYYYWFLQP